jgi:hypothetical protein
MAAPDADAPRTPAARVDASSPRALDLASTHAMANIEAFVASSAPVFASRARSTRDFALSELWDAFDESSAFGAEVPLRLQDGQPCVSQYYVPFLSGMQLFVRDDGDDGDGGDGDDDGDGDGARRRRDGRAGTRLIYEFFETASPYSRAPFREIIELILDEQAELRALTSADLAPSSWMSVAWYPIYRIPQGTMLHDVQGCFLTYHALYAGELRDGDIACPLPPEMSKLSEELLAQRVARAKERASASDDAGAGDGANAAPRVHILRPFGLSMYKMQGDVWAANDDVTDWMNKLMDGAYTWLRMRKTVHPDYEFFSHFG